MTFAPSKMEHPSLRSQLFPEMNNKKLNLKNYKSRTGLYNTRNVVVKKDTKDIRYRHLIGTEFDMHADEKGPGPSNKQLQDRAKFAKAGAVPRQQKTSKTSASRGGPPPVRRHQTSVNPSQTSLISTLSGFSQGSGTITLTDEQLRTILSLVGGSASNTQQNQNQVSQVLPPIQSQPLTTVVEREVPPPVIETVQVHPTSRSTTKAQINLPIAPGHTYSPKKDIPIAKVEPSIRKENVAYASSFQIGGDGAPALDPITERRNKAKEQWRLDLQNQMREQQERKEREKAKNKDSRLGSADWHNTDIKSFKQQSDQQTEAMQLLADKNTKIKNSFEATVENTVRSSFETNRLENHSGRSVPHALQQTVETAQRPHIKTNYAANQKSTFTPGNTGFFSSPKDEQERKIENRKRQEAELRKQIEDNKQRKADLKKAEEDREAYEESRVRLECQMLTRKHQQEQLGATIDQPSISKQIEDVLSPRSKTVNPGNFLNPENPNNPSRLIEAQHSPRNVNQLRQSNSQLSNYQRHEATPLGDYEGQQKLPEIKKIDSQIYKVKIDHNLLATAKPEKQNNEVWIDLDLSHLQIQTIEERIRDKLLKEYNEKHESDRRMMQEQADRLSELENRAKKGNNFKSKKATAATGPRKWGQSSAKTTFIPASQRNISTDKFNAQRKARLEKRQNELLREQERQMINTERKRQVADEKHRKKIEKRERIRMEEEQIYSQAVEKNMAPPITQSVSPRNYRNYHEERAPVGPEPSVSNNFNLKFSDQNPIKSPSMTQTNHEAYFDTKVSNVVMSQRPITGNNHNNNDLVAKNHQRMQKLGKNGEQDDPSKYFNMMRQGMRQRADQNMRLQDGLYGQSNQ